MLSLNFFRQYSIKSLVFTDSESRSKLSPASQQRFVLCQNKLCTISQRSGSATPIFLASCTISRYFSNKEIASLELKSRKAFPFDREVPDSTPKIRINGKHSMCCLKHLVEPMRGAVDRCKCKLTCLRYAYRNTGRIAYS